MEEFDAASPREGEIRAAKVGIVEAICRRFRTLKVKRDSLLASKAGIVHPSLGGGYSLENDLFELFLFELP